MGFWPVLLVSLVLIARSDFSLWMVLLTIGVDKNDVISDTWHNQVRNEQLDLIEEDDESQEDNPPQVSDNESEISEPRRSTREMRQPENLNVLSMKGQSYLQKLEQVHNLVVQSIRKKKMR